MPSLSSLLQALENEINVVAPEISDRGKGILRTQVEHLIRCLDSRDQNLSVGGSSLRH
jgi:hypothetical protein